MHIAVVGGGPAGLMAAETAVARGAEVTVFEGKPSVGRKFLVAGKGGLNLTKAEPTLKMAAKYHGPDQPIGFWERLLAAFGPEDLRAWARALGVETMVAKNGRVYPCALRSATLLRRWVQRLRSQGVRFAVRQRLEGWSPARQDGMCLEFAGGAGTVAADAAVLALGGGSWPQTGSDGGWVSLLHARGVAVRTLEPANCGWEVAWPIAGIEAVEGQPLKNVAARVEADDAWAMGEMLLTRYGLEGGCLYQLGRALRKAAAPRLVIDFKPDSTPEQLARKLPQSAHAEWTDAGEAWKLSAVAQWLLAGFAAVKSGGTAAELARAVKSCPISLLRPRPLAEAISSAGGIAWSEVDGDLMLRRWPGLFVAGEMLDWEAPTGGYLLQGALATGRLAGASAVSVIAQRALHRAESRA